MPREEIQAPEEPARLVQHEPVDVLLTHRRSQGEERTVLAGRSSTQHLRPNGAIVIVRPPFEPARPSPVKRGDAVHARFKRTGRVPLEAEGVVSWIRPKAFLPSGLAVSLVGITFDWDPDEMGLEVAAFLARHSLRP